MSILAANRVTCNPAPHGRYDDEGNLVVDIGEALAASALLPLTRFALTSALPPAAFDWEPGGDTLWIRWDHARAVERILVQLWPDVTVTASANPGYRSVRGGAR